MAVKTLSRRHARALGKLSKGWMVAGAIAGTGFLPSGSCYSPANLAICPSKVIHPVNPLHLDQMQQLSKLSQEAYVGQTCQALTGLQGGLPGSRQ
ncbi:TPA: hypothetical protein ACH3X1_014855 [Trebouxia sp. C0004]